MIYVDGGTCSTCGPEEFGCIQAEDSQFLVFSVHKETSDPDDLVRFILDFLKLCQDCDETFKGVKSRLVGGVQCPHNPDRVHVVFFLCLEDPRDQLAFALRNCLYPITDEQRLRLIEINKAQVGDLWIGTGPFTETPEIEETDDDFNVDDLLAEIALLLSGDEPQD